MQGTSDPDAANLNAIQRLEITRKPRQYSLSTTWWLLESGSNRGGKGLFSYGTAYIYASDGLIDIFGCDRLSGC